MNHSTSTETMENMAPQVMRKRKLFTTEIIVKIAVLAAAASVLQLLEFPVPIAPAFVKFDLSDLPALIGAFALGPIPAVMIEVVKNAISVLLQGSSSGLVGQIANIILGASIVVPAGIVYQRNKTFKGAVTGLVISVVSFVFIGAAINIFVLMPLYSRIYMPTEAIIKMAQAVNPNVNTINQVVFMTMVPFNILKGVILSVVTLLIYKPISPLLKAKK